MTAKEKKILEYSKKYYEGNPEISDSEFDDLIETLRKENPKSKVLKKVGSPITANRKKLEHKIPMLSAAKAKTPEEVIDWLNRIGIRTDEKKYKSALILEPKIDGLSSTIVYGDGKVTYMATRGDGVVGQDITHIVPHLNIPNNINWPGHYEVRGELHIPKNSEVPNPDGKPLRNMAVGFVNRKDNFEDLKYVEFVAYQLLYSGNQYVLDDFHTLRSKGFKSVETRVITEDYDISKDYTFYLEKLREEWLYETDGIMLVINDKDMYDDIDSKYTVDHHHHYNIALKPPAESKETILEDIEWNVTRQGSVVPIAILKPVNISGRMVKRASLSNYDNVIRMKLESGDKVELEVANDVIPYLKKNITKGVSQR